MEKHLTAAIPREWIGQKVRVLTSVTFAHEIKGVLSNVGTDYIVVGKDVINVAHVVRIRRA